MVFVGRTTWRSWCRSSAKRDDELPICEFWSNDTQRWSTDGCWLSKWDESLGLATCACSHPTTIRVIASETFEPSLNLDTVWEWRPTTFESVSEQTDVLWNLAALLFAFVLLCCCCSVYASDCYDRPLLAYRESIFQRFWMQSEGADEAVALTILDSLPNKASLGFGLCAMCADNLMSTLRVIGKVLALDLRNEHSLFSLLWRPRGTNFSMAQRIACESLQAFGIGGSGNGCVAQTALDRSVEHIDVRFAHRGCAVTAHALFVH